MSKLNEKAPDATFPECEKVASPAEVKDGEAKSKGEAEEQIKKP